MENRISELMAKLDISEVEARQLMADDEAIDHGANLFPLTKEQEQASKKARQADRSPTVYKFNKREKKADEGKSFWLNTLFNAVLPLCDTYEVANSEREFSFTKDGRKYKVVLSCPRN